MHGIEEANHNKEGAPYQYVVGMLHDTENDIRYEIQAGIRIPRRTTGRHQTPHYSTTDAEKILTLTRGMT